MGLVVTDAGALAGARAWAAYEVGAVDLGDRRRNARLVEFVARGSLHPASSIPETCEEWGMTKAMYGLFHSPRVTPAAILAPHVRRTAERAAREAVVLALQDTMCLDYSHHPSTRGLGPISDHPTAQGMWVHSVLLCTVALPRKGGAGPPGAVGAGAGQAGPAAPAAPAAHLGQGEPEVADGA